MDDEDDEDDVLALPDVEEEPPEPFDELPVEDVDEPPEALPEVSEELEDGALAVSFLSPPDGVDAPEPLDEPFAAARESVL